ncbi:OsmC family protein [Actinomadura sp. WMMB 499]|uniref:OsmC family protein n=1 Tax=Actinomadura sp. WMMB 499 TaxID=1219491 RepID=UPI0012493830|nr:OsmC family protein [Actinomadura sp. WMMB 499]QFG21276.1 OsmC family protein [Actinomadura sp. WMMB 499]
MNSMTVLHREKTAFAVIVRDHVVNVDQPYTSGGLDCGPTPVELFVAALAACAAHHGRGYLVRRGLPADGLEVTADFAMAPGNPPRVTRVGLDVRPPLPLSPEDSAGFRAAVEACTVRNSIDDPPRIGVHVEPAVPAVA